MTADARLGKTTQRLIETSDVIVSTASVWEMVLKNAKGKLPLPKGALTEQLEAQALNESLTLLTRDAAILELGLDGIVKG
jgi:PIN domain nuclease of toxin-antitoxin system